MRIKGWIGFFFVLVGILIAGGASGDCDGACPEYSNSLVDTLLFSLLGLGLMATGVLFVLRDEG